MARIIAMDLVGKLEFFRNKQYIENRILIVS